MAVPAPHCCTPRSSPLAQGRRGAESALTNPRTAFSGHRTPLVAVSRPRTDSASSNSSRKALARSGSDWRLTSLAGVAIKRMRYIKGDEECQLLIREGDQAESVLVVRIYPR